MVIAYRRFQPQCPCVHTIITRTRRYAPALCRDMPWHVRDTAPQNQSFRSVERFRTCHGTSLQFGVMITLLSVGTCRGMSAITPSLTIVSQAPSGRWSLGRGEVRRSRTEPLCHRHPQKSSPIGATDESIFLPH